ncbi:helix-turn-helix domain-containing protein [Rhodococcus sp. 14-2483-1-2]|uniref:TetR/AcrR family transcriptional regulator n=1 Tax=Rhodococcus sp. 14-2483-1-2 TaxID=2023147 RepID=UPI000B9B756D|nr:helix-turn-helix domain-containing protein [Rhodococcus sp. 14-2483-1-2]OZF26123.1 TetR family transcriptional regulator [Rhodococcus sp. 14-2483-1-2]
MPSNSTVDRAAIVSAARRMLERDGVAGLSMRRLADELGSKPMTLYHHVANKSELLSLVLTDIAAEIEWATPTGSPRERMVEIGMDMHHRLSSIAWIVPVLRTGTTVGTPALALADRFLSAALETGMTELRALSLWRSTWYLATSELMWQAELAERPDNEQSWFDKIDPTVVAQVAPTVAGLLPRWPQHSAAFDLRAAITAQIDGTISTPGFAH